MIDQLEEWGTWAPRNFAKPPTRRKAKRWINTGVLNGQIIGSDVFVCRDNPFPSSAEPDVEAMALELLS